MNLEVQIWNVHLVKAFNTHVQEAEFLYSLLSAENKRKTCVSFCFHLLKNFTTNLKTEVLKLQYRAARSRFCIPAQDRIKNSFPVCLQLKPHRQRHPSAWAPAEEPSSRLRCESKVARGKGRQSRTGLKSRVSLHLVGLNTRHDSESKESRSEFQPGEWGHAIKRRGVGWCT